MLVPEIVRNKAVLAGAARWLNELPAIVASLERDWSITVGSSFGDGTEALVAEAEMADGTPAVLKVTIPREGTPVQYEITALRLADGDGCARLLRADESRNAMLLERLGKSLADLALPIAERHEILCATAQRVWRPVPHDCGLPSGAEKGRWLAEFVVTLWEELDRPCSEAAVDYALVCADRRVAAQALEQYGSALAHWRAECDELAALLHLATTRSGGTSSTVILKNRATAAAGRTRRGKTGGAGGK